MIKVFKAPDTSCRSGTFPPKGTDIVIRIDDISSVEVKKLKKDGITTLIQMRNGQYFFLADVTPSEVAALMEESESQARQISISG